MTLAELKSMTPEQLHDHWAWSKFPFDCAECGRCLTAHRKEPKAMSCSYEYIHKSLKDAVPTVGWWTGLFKPSYKQITPKWLVKHLDELYALRLFFKYLYPSTPEVEEPQPVEETVEAT